MDKKIEWLDGIKGLSSIGVFLHHFLLAFLPAIYFGANSVSHFRNIDTYLATSPIIFMINGNYLVCLFCIISGIIMSYKIMTLKKESLVSSIIIKRYLRLSLPIFFVSLFVFILMKLNLFSNVETSSYTGSSWLSSYYLNSNLIGIWNLIYSSFVGALFLGDFTFSNAFWMLKILFFGSFISIILGQIYWEFKNKSIYIYILLSLIFLSINSMYALFPMGAIISYLMINKIKINKIVCCIILFLGIFLGGYPSPILPNNIYSILNFIPYSEFRYLVIHMIGAFLTILGIMNLVKIQKLLSNKWLQKLNNISLAVYLVHIPILFSFSTKVFNMLFINTGRYLLSVSITLLLTVPILFIMSYLFNKYIEKNLEVIVNKIIKKLKDK